MVVVTALTMSALMPVDAGAVAVARARVSSRISVAIYADGSFPATVPAVHTAEPGEALFAAGRYSPGDIRSITIQMRAPSGRWHTASPGPNTGRGTYWAQLTPVPATGRYEYRAVLAATRTQARAVSATWQVRVVRPRNTLGVLSLSARGRLVSGAGVVVPPRPGHPVQVQALRAGHWTQVAQVLQGAGGRYRFTVMADVVGRQTYRTVAQEYPRTVGSTFRTVGVPRATGPARIDLADVDGLWTYDPPLRGTRRIGQQAYPKSVELASSDGGTSLTYLLSPGLRSLRTTVRWTPVGRVTMGEVFVVSTDRRTVLIRDLVRGTAFPLTVDLSGAKWLEFSQYALNADVGTSDVLLQRPQLTTRAAPQRGFDPRIRYLGDLVPTSRTSQCVGTGVAYLRLTSRVASLLWGYGVLGRHTCGAGGSDSITYRLAGRYTRFHGAVEEPDIGYSAGTVEVIADGHALATATSGDVLDLDVSGVRTLRFTFRNAPRLETRPNGWLVIVTPTLRLAARPGTARCRSGWGEPRPMRHRRCHR